MKVWVVIFLGGLITYGIRLSFILLWGKIKTPGLLLRSLRYVPPAVLSAIIFPELLIRNGEIEVSLLNSRMIAGIVAIIVAWRFRNSLITIIVGMIALILMELLIR
jgi:branched-subunit amino acid transport protein